MERIYFPNLNGLRFIAATMVMVHHIELTKYWMGQKNSWMDSSIQLIGKLGVILFFVLSGFLITCLLLVEKKYAGTISIRNFYMRRILRIWPLYYLLVLLSFFVFSKIPFLQSQGLPRLAEPGKFAKLSFFIFFLPNLALVYFPLVPFLSQSWSVGVEEQFYLVWPLLMKRFKNIAVLLYTVIAVYLFIKIPGFKLMERYIYWSKGMEIAKSFTGDFSIDCMAIGGLFGLYLYKNDQKLSFFFNIYVQWIVILLLIVLIWLGVHIPFLHNEIYALLFGILILNLVGNPEAPFNLEKPFFNYMGKISYGLYMYHPLVIVIILKLLPTGGIMGTILQYLLVMTLTALLASCSYFFFERSFIKRKIKYSKFITGDNATETHNPD